MKFHEQNELYTYISFWDNKVLKVSLGMPEHAWPGPTKLTYSVDNFDTNEAAC